MSYLPRALTAVALLLFAITAALLLWGATASAQPRPSYNPLEEVFRSLERGRTTTALNCSAETRLNRRGDVIWLRMTCEGDRRRYGEGR